MALDRMEALATLGFRALVARAKHHRHRGAINVGVEQANAQPELVQRDRDIGRNCRLAHSALAAGDRDDAPDAIESYAAGLLAKLGVDATRLQLNFKPQLMVELVMDAGGQLLHYFRAI